MDNKHVVILGAGIAGLTTAIALKRLGISYTIYEAAQKIGPVGAGLGLGANAIKAFKELRIDQEVIRAGNIVSTFSVRDQKGNVITRADSIKISAKYGTDNFTIHRHALHEVLLRHAGADSVICNKRAVDFARRGQQVELKFSDGTSALADYLIVADGLHSCIRKKLLPGSTERFAGYTCWRGIVSGSSLNIKEASEYWGSKGRFGVVPLANNEVYWFMCVNTSRNNSTVQNYKIKDLMGLFNDYASPVPGLIERTDDSRLIWADICDLKPIKQFAFDNILLIGDAAHATTPNMGQGACMAIEDAVFLGRLIEQHKDFKKAFSGFEKLRLKRTHFIVNRSWQIGKVAQWQNPVAIKLRNFLLKLLPSSTNEKQLAFLYNINFNDLKND